MQAALVERPVCPLCGSTNSLPHIPFRDIPVVKCSTCGFIRSSKILPKDKILNHYKEDFGDERQRKGQIVNGIVNSWVLKHMLANLPISNVLDVGTGYGFTLGRLTKLLRIDGEGIELSQIEAKYATSVLGLRVFNSSLAESPLREANYDLVTSFEVIEHVPDPCEFIAESLRYVKTNGYLLIMTDNFEGQMARCLGAELPKWIPHEHISHFSPRTLQLAVTRVGGLEQVQFATYTPWDLLLRGLYFKMSGRGSSRDRAVNSSNALKPEAQGYRLFRLRKALNRVWVQLSLRNSLDGDVMFALFRKIS